MVKKILSLFKKYPEVTITGVFALLVALIGIIPTFLGLFENPPYQPTIQQQVLGENSGKQSNIISTGDDSTIINNYYEAREALANENWDNPMIKRLADVCHINLQGDSFQVESQLNNCIDYRVEPLSKLNIPNTEEIQEQIYNAWSVRDYNKANEVLDSIGKGGKLSLTETATISYLKGMNYFYSGSYEQAIDELTIAYSIDRENSEYITNLGGALMFAGRYEESLEYYEYLNYLLNKEDINKNDDIEWQKNRFNLAGNQHNIGSIKYFQGYYDEAIEYYEKSLDIKIKTFGENDTSLLQTYDQIIKTYLLKEESTGISQQNKIQETLNKINDINSSRCKEQAGEDKGCLFYDY